MKKTLLLMLICAIMLLALFGCTKGEATRDKISYDITAQLNDDVLTCAQKTVLKNVYKEDLDNIVLALYPNAYAENIEHPAYSVNLQKYGGLEIKKLLLNGVETEGEYSVNKTFLTLPLAPTKKGEEIAIDIEYDVTIPECDLRFGTKDGYYNISNFYPQVTVFDNGSFRSDDFSVIGDPVFSPLADFKVKLDIPDNMVAAAAGNATEVIEGGRKIVETTLTDARDLSFVLNEGYLVANKDINGVAVKYYYVTDDDPQHTVDVAAQAIGVFSNNFGAYPYETFVVASTVFNEEGMEFSGLVYVAEDSLDKERTIIHETAHQWFYNMVGSDNINAAYLDEGLTTFCTEYFYLLTDNEEKYNEDMAEIELSYMRYEKLQRVRGENARLSATEPIYDYTSYQYGMLVYYKTALLFKNLYDMGGKEKFNASIKSYVENNLFEIADKEDLIAAFNEGMKTDTSGYVNGYLSDGMIVATFAA